MIPIPYWLIGQYAITKSLRSKYLPVLYLKLHKFSCTLFTKKQCIKDWEKFSKEQGSDPPKQWKKAWKQGYKSAIDWTIEKVKHSP